MSSTTTATNAASPASGAIPIPEQGGCEGCEGDTTALPPPVPFPPQPQQVIYYGRILLGEITPLLASLKRTTHRWSSHAQEADKEPLVERLQELRTRVSALRPGDPLLEPQVFLDPFLAVVRSEDTTGPVTRDALAAVNRMLGFGLVWGSGAAEAVASAVTHARFVGTEAGADEVVLWEILTVLRSLLLGPAGSSLTDESVCEILNSCFRICFEPRLSELLRTSTEDALRHMVTLLFSRLGQFPDDHHHHHHHHHHHQHQQQTPGQPRRLKMRTGATTPSHTSDVAEETVPTPDATPASPISPVESEGEVTKEVSAPSDAAQQDTAPHDAAPHDTASIDSGIDDPLTLALKGNVDISGTHLPSPPEPESSLETAPGYVNAQGVRFTPERPAPPPVSPYGLPCVRELLRFLVSLTSPSNPQNTPPMILTATSLLTAALEVGADSVPRALSLLALIKDQLCRNLVQLLTPEQHRLPVFTAAARLCALLCESLRTHLKYQLEVIMTRLMEVASSEAAGVSYGHKELALETLAQLVRVPGLPTELYLNYDCDLYSADLYEELAKTLSKLAFPMDGLQPTHLLCVDTLCALLEDIESRPAYCPTPEEEDDRPVRPVHHNAVECVLSGQEDSEVEGSGLDIARNDMKTVQISKEDTEEAPQVNGATTPAMQVDCTEKQLAQASDSDSPPIQVDQDESQPIQVTQEDFSNAQVIQSNLQPAQVYQGELEAVQVSQDDSEPAQITQNDLQSVQHSQDDFKKPQQDEQDSLQSKHVMENVAEHVEVNDDKESQAVGEVQGEAVGDEGDSTEPVAPPNGPSVLESGHNIPQMVTTNTTMAMLSDSSDTSTTQCRLDYSANRVTDSAKVGAGASGPLLEPRAILRDGRAVPRGRLLALKEQKRLLAAGTEQFNTKPEKGIKFLQEAGVVGSTPGEVAAFLRHNPRLCKHALGNFLSRKRNAEVLTAFVESFPFRGQRIDQALRTFLESFRLPGEAPMIALILEHFASHWHCANGQPFASDDAAFTLAYGVILLNVDQHSPQARRQNTPMTLDQFRANLRGVNGGGDFPPALLEQMYRAVRADEFVMPSEQAGAVREEYVWRMLLKRGATRDGRFLLANGSPALDRELFALAWGPALAALSYVFDGAADEAVARRAVAGLGRVAAVSARYALTEVFDSLVVTLCRLTGLAAPDPPDQLAATFGTSPKAQLAARALFSLATAHGDILRDGWRNIVELMLQLFRCRLLPTTLLHAEDFVEASGLVALTPPAPATTPRAEGGGLLSSIYSYIALGDAPATRPPSSGEQEAVAVARRCLEGCRPERLVEESAFLRPAALHDLLKACVAAGEQLATPGEYAQAFLLELVVRTLLANKDRAHVIWPAVRTHLHGLLMSAAASERHFLVERCVVALLRLAKVLLRRPQLATPILQGLRVLLLLRPPVMQRVALQVVCGLREVLSVNTEHIQDPSDWTVLFTLLECAGAGAKPPRVLSPEEATTTTTTTATTTTEPGTPTSDSDGTVDSGVGTEDSAAAPTNTAESPLPSPRTALPGEEGAKTQPLPRTGSPDILQGSGGWILVGRGGEVEPVLWGGAGGAGTGREWDIVPVVTLGDHRPEALLRAVDALGLLVRDRRISPAALPAATAACRTFTEATLHGGRVDKRRGGKESASNGRLPQRRKSNAPSGRRRDGAGRGGGVGGGAGGGSVRRPKSPSSAYDADESDSEDHPLTYQQVSEKLLDLMGTLHSSAGQIVGLYRDAGEGPGPGTHLNLWSHALCPLLQGIARYCCDSRTNIRNLAMTYLQRALLNHDLQTLSPVEWEGLFNKVLFPLLAKLLHPLPGTPPQALEETRVRAATLVQKVYLRHLTPLLSLPTFTALWLTILEFMDKYLNTHRSDHLSDAIPEILKNMLLVMETTQVFHTADGFTRLWSITWDRIDAFLPALRHNLFRSHPPSEIQQRDVMASPGPSPPPGPPSPPPPPTEGGPGAGEGREDRWAGGSGQTVDDSIPPTLREQQAARLSLSQENLPASIGTGVILQPPLPSVPPPSAPPSCPSTTLPPPQGLSSIPLASGSLIDGGLPSTLLHLSPSQAPISMADIPSLQLEPSSPQSAPVPQYNAQFESSVPHSAQTPQSISSPHSTTIPELNAAVPHSILPIPQFDASVPPHVSSIPVSLTTNLQPYTATVLPAPIPAYPPSMHQSGQTPNSYPQFFMPIHQPPAASTPSHTTLSVEDRSVCAPSTDYSALCDSSVPSSQPLPLSRDGVDQGTVGLSPSAPCNPPAGDWSPAGQLEGGLPATNQSNVPVILHPLPVFMEKKN